MLSNLSGRGTASPGQGSLGPAEGPRPPVSTLVRRQQPGPPGFDASRGPCLPPLRARQGSDPRVSLPCQGLTCYCSTGELPGPKTATRGTGLRCSDRAYLRERGRAAVHGQPSVPWVSRAPKRGLTCYCSPLGSLVGGSQPGERASTVRGSCGSLLPPATFTGQGWSVLGPGRAVTPILHLLSRLGADLA